VVASFRHQFTLLGNGLVQVNYTFSHAFDEVSNGGGGFTSGSSPNPQDPQDLRGAYGPAEYDIRHSMSAGLCVGNTSEDSILVPQVKSDVAVPTNRGGSYSSSAPGYY